jgi:hypothetical protein
MKKHCHICGKTFGFFKIPILKYSLVPICEECNNKENSAEFIDSWKKMSIAELIALLGNYDINNQRNAAKYLGLLKDRRAVIPLIEALKDGGHNDFILTYNIIFSLGEIGDARALKEIKKWENKKSIQPGINRIAALMLKRLKQKKFLNMSNIVDSDLKNISWQQFEDKICEFLDAIPSNQRTNDKGIDAITKKGIPIQIKQSEKIGRPVVDQFCHAIKRYYNDSGMKSSKKGILVAFSFTDGAYEEVSRTRIENDLDIELKTVDEILKE